MRGGEGEWRSVVVLKGEEEGVGSYHFLEGGRRTGCLPPWLEEPRI